MTVVGTILVNGKTLNTPGIIVRTDVISTRVRERERRACALKKNKDRENDENMKKQKPNLFSSFALVKSNDNKMKTSR